MNLIKRFVPFAAALALCACVQEEPTSIGDVLLGGGEFVSVEVTLPASQFLLQDTSFSGYSKPAAANFVTVANKFENVVDANGLMRFSTYVSTISVRNAAGVIVADSAPKFTFGRMVVKFDTISTNTKPTRLRLYRTAQFDISATWTDRVDTVGSKLPWQTPGGTRGASIDTATWAGTDSVVFTVDSATLRMWNDTTNKTRGVLIVSETPNSRVRIQSTVVHVNAQSSIRPDTAVTIDIVPSIRTFLINPTLPASSPDIRVGGVPSWRSILRLRPDLGTLKFPCNNGQAACTIALDSAHLTQAQLILKSARSPLGFLPEDTMFIEARSVVLSNAIPLERTPTGSQIGVSSHIAPSLFALNGSGEVKINVTGFMRNLVNADAVVANKLLPYIALIQIPDASTQGFAVFDSAPVLRIVLTAALEK